MRILQLIDSLDSGGAERMAVNYANMLSQDNVSFICATRAEGLLKQAIGTEVGYFFLNKKKTLDFKALKRLHTYIKTHNIDIIHAHSTSFFMATLIKIFNRKIKLIWHDHYGNSEFLKHRKFKILKFCSTQFDGIISVNKFLKYWSENNLNCERVLILNNFVISNDKEIKETSLKGESEKRIVCLANLRLQKNHFMLLDAFKKVHECYPDWTLHLVGKDQSDGYSLKLKESIKRLELDENVFIYGSKSDVHHILNQSSIGVLSSSSEGLPLALLEYGLAKLAVVATNVGDCNKIITNNSEGVLVNPNDVDAFSKGLLKYINNEDERIQAGEMLYKIVANNFGAKKNLEQLISIYNKV